MPISRRDMLREIFRRPSGELAGLLMPGGLKRALGLGEQAKALSPEEAASIAQQFAVQGQEFWQVISIAAPQSGKPVTWYVGGTQPGLDGTPYAVVLVIEGNASELATQIGQAILQALQWGKASGSP